MSVALLLIDAQKGFLEPYWGERNNPDAEGNIRTLLDAFRRRGSPVIHVHHLSTEPNSPLRPGQAGAEPMEGCEPRGGERLFQKSVHAAFLGTGLERFLRDEGIKDLVLAGFATDHCVSTSARMAADLGFGVTVVTDATATFARDGFPAELVHQVQLASLGGEFAELRTTRNLILRS